MMLTFKEYLSNCTDFDSAEMLSIKKMMAISLDDFKNELLVPEKSQYCVATVSINSSMSVSEPIIGILNVTNDSQISECLKIELKIGNIVGEISVLAGPGSTNTEIMVPESMMGVFSAESSDVFVSVIDGSFRILATVKGIMTLVGKAGSTETELPETNHGHVSKKKIYANAEFIVPVDTKIHKDGMTKVCTVALDNHECEDQDMTLSIMFEGKEVSCEKICISAKSKKLLTVRIPAPVMRRDDTYISSIDIKIIDDEGRYVLARNYAVTVRSRFDLDLTKITQLTFEAIDPLCPMIKDFITRSDGGLAKQMKSQYSVKNYMTDSKEIVFQLTSLFYALVNHGMSYVSDTRCTENDGRYQRVRSPDKCLVDHSANCFEFSLILASMLECMGFESIIVFPKGHAIVGAVMKTNAYRSYAIPVEGPYAEFITRISLGGDKYVDVLMFESTFCAHKDVKFTEAVKTATDNLRSEKDEIEKNEGYCLYGLESTKTK